MSNKKVKTCIRYPGGKSKAAYEIAERFPAGRANVYQEPFLGGGSLFLAASHNDFGNRYWINDLYYPLFCFWNTLKDQRLGDELVQSLYELHSDLNSPEALREFYEGSRDLDPEGDPFELAVKFFALNRMTFSGTVESGGFSASSAVERFTLSSIDRVGAIVESNILKNVRITNLDAVSIIRKLNKYAACFIMIDAPYYHAKKLYGKKGELQNFDHERLSSTLQKSDHQFLATYDDCPEIRKLYKWANIEEWQLQYGMSRKKGDELIIKNY